MESVSLATRIRRILIIAGTLAFLRFALYFWGKRRRRLTDDAAPARRVAESWPLLKTKFGKRDDFAHVLFRAAREARELPYGMGVIHDSITGGKGDVILITRPQDVTKLLSRSVTHNLGPLREYTQSFIGENTLFSLEGEAWREQRHRLASLLTPDEVRERFRPQFESVSFDLCTKLGEWIRFSPVVDLHSVFQRFHVACVGKAFLANKLGFFDKALIGGEGEHGEILEAFEYLLKAMGNRSKSAAMAAEWDTHANKARARVDELVKLRTGTSTTTNDVLQFMFAGYNTAVVVQCFTLFYLTQNPAWMAQVQRDVDAVLGVHDFSNKTGNAVNLEGLPVLRAVFMEALRLVPPTVFTARRLETDIEFDGFTLFAGTDVFVPILFLAQDGHVWGEDWSLFHPSRWLRGTAAAPEGSFVPFSAGPRSCLGESFAIDSSLTVLALLLYFFNFETPPGSKQAPRWTGYGIRPFDAQVDAVCLNLKVSRRIRPKKSGAVVVRKDASN